MYQHGGDIYRNKIELDFSSNVNLMGIPEGVLRAAKRGIDFSCNYPDAECNELREAISKVENISKDMIICGNGAADLIFSLVLTTKPKKALLLSPTFHEYEQALLSVDCEIRYHQLLEKNGFQLCSDFIEMITADIDIVFLCNPNNPTGALIKKLLMDKIVQKCEASNCLLVVDECFMDFVPYGKDESLKERCTESKNLFVLKAFTKLYAIPGLRLGYGFCGNVLLLNKMKNTKQPWSVSIPAQMAGIAALRECEYVNKSLEMIEREKNYLIQQLCQLNFKVYDSKANYIFFRANISLYEKCLEQGVLIRDCSNYIGLTDGYYRIVVKTHSENVKLIELLSNILEDS
ncbi:MAG: aminotransferase class I/II-fold pyridoxal phosphate-dependent enzyme [Clostridia bacterium]|nr:aminotransferase class I/II-fold pyridoxal phosphate-dependent enzyme [Clostridia bacterium]NCD03474.1 aminotransferase class I/II-fold pyridoxal phosphate-dependent enzyme [Clostridia bacterium]